MISQGSNYTILKLRDKQEVPSSFVPSVNGTWRHTDESYRDAEIKFTSDNPEYLYWEFRQLSRLLLIGSKMGRASHKAGEDEIFQVLITLFGVMRLGDDRFKPASGDEGEGLLAYRVGDDFSAGKIAWSVNYMH